MLQIPELLLIVVIDEDLLELVLICDRDNDSDCLDRADKN